MRLLNVFTLCALGTALAVGCGDDDDDDGGGGTGGNGTGASAGAETGGTGGGTGGSGTGATGTGGGGGEVGGAPGEGFCAATCETATVDEDCGEDNAFVEYECDSGFCVATAKPCDDEVGDDQNCDIGGLGLSACVEVDGETSCLTLCDPDDVVDTCEVLGGDCTGEGTSDGDDVNFCETEAAEPSCGEGIDEGDPCIIGGGEGGAGGAGSQNGTCSAEGTCVCSSNSECTVDGFACKTD
jgi:hypothetical protein